MEPANITYQGAHPAGFRAPVIEVNAMESTTTTTTTARATVKAIAFGDKGAIARTLTTKGAELKASILASAILPMLSNFAAGHGTFKPLIKGEAYKGACPLQLAVVGLKGKARAARDSAFALARAAADQADHDALIEAAELAMMAALAPATASDKPARVDYKAQAETLKAEAAALRAERDAYAAALQAAGLALPKATA